MSRVMELCEVQLMWTKSKYFKYLLLFSAFEEFNPVARVIGLSHHDQTTAVLLDKFIVRM
jgi:hypothetical protein